jgi:AcrR family transcriptional regulator
MARAPGGRSGDATSSPLTVARAQAIFPMETNKTIIVSYGKAMKRSTTDREKKEKIIERSRTLFLAQGVSSLSMDRIAAVQGISKKTLYRFFPNKEALVLAAVEAKIAEVGRLVSAIAADRELLFPIRLRNILQTLSRQIGELSENLIKDLYYHEPKLWQRIDRFRQEYVFTVITKLFEDGMKSGHIRPEIDSRLAPVLFINAFSTVMTPAQFINLSASPAEVFEAFLRILFSGILTEKAQRQLFAQEGKP